MCRIWPVCRFCRNTKGTGLRPSADCACRSCRRPVGRASASSFSFREPWAQQSRCRVSCGRVVRTTAAVEERVGCGYQSCQDQRDGRNQPQDAGRCRMTECFVEAPPEDELREGQREDDCRVTKDMTSPCGGLSETAAHHDLDCDCKNPRAPDQSTRWMTMGLSRVGFCRVPSIPGLKASGAQAPVFRRPARKAERVRIVGMTSSMSAAPGSLSRCSSASEGAV